MYTATLSNGVITNTKVVDIVGSTTLLFMTFSCEIVYYLKILFEVIIF
jgi:hypothetical protein